MTFTNDFIFGVTTSSYQIEGAHHLDGRTDSIWDTFSHHNWNVSDGKTGDDGINYYLRYEEDLELLEELGVDAYRFSISWSRIIPKKGVINQKGIEFYRKIINTCKQKGIKTCVTLYHHDLPQWIDDEKSGWINRETITYFKDYCEIIFTYFIDVVDQWITFDNPFHSAAYGYLFGIHAPGHKSYQDYLMAHHHLLLGHGEAVISYRKQGGKAPIGIALNLSHIDIPSYSIPNELANLACDGFKNRMYLDPLFKGDYPKDFLLLLAKEIDDFEFIKQEDLKVISEPIDFLGVNYFTRDYIQYNPRHLLLFEQATSYIDKTSMEWEVTPWSLCDLIKRIRRDYTMLPVFITANGAAFDDQLIQNQVYDQERIDFIEDHLVKIHKCNDEGLNIIGFFVYSLFDQFEWHHGYTKRFGLIYVDFKTNKRIRKNSYSSYQTIIKNRKL